MTRYDQFIRDALGAHPGRIIKSDKAVALLDAHELLSSAHAEAQTLRQQILEEANKEAAAIIAAAHDEATRIVNEAREDAMRDLEISKRETLEEIHLKAFEEARQLSQHLSTALDRLADEVSTTIEAAVRHIIGNMDLAEATAHAARLVIDELKTREGLKLCVHPQNRHFAEKIQGFLGDRSGIIAIETNDILPLESCILATETGGREIGIELQLQTLFNHAQDTGRHA